MESVYDDAAAVRKAVELGQHRDIIGGLWDDLGKAQLDFMISAGLLPHHKLLDLGCGCLRGGVFFVRYLEPGNYFGVDINQSLLDAGYDVELAAAGLCGRLPRANLICSSDFELPVADQTFDFALAQSVFTHMSFNRIRGCLERIARTIRPRGLFYATFFELPENVPSSAQVRHAPGGVTTCGWRDPYHYRFRDLQYAAADLPWTPRYIGGWNHPRGQSMAIFMRQDGVGSE